MRFLLMILSLLFILVFRERRRQIEKKDYLFANNGRQVPIFAPN